MRNKISKVQKIMKNGGIQFGNCMILFAAALCSLSACGVDKVVKASSFGWNAEDSTAALQAANKSFYFCVPAESELVSVNISPLEPVQAKLFDASGKEVADMPYQSAIMNFNVKRNKTVSDEVWHLKFVKILDDMRFQVGVGGIPLVSTNPNAVIGRK